MSIENPFLILIGAMIDAVIAGWLIWAGWDGYKSGDEKPKLNFKKGWVRLGPITYGVILAFVAIVMFVIAGNKLASGDCWYEHLYIA